MLTPVMEDYLKEIYLLREETGGVKIALLAERLGKLPFAVALSRASQAIIRQNLALAVIALLLVTSVLGLVQLSWAVVLHEGSTVLVVLNALRLLGYQERRG
ncbi:MAG: hypothetical protein H0T73_07050 [Ardenticatenales bacterium]|nr:hypothetical protein [Ardenticatenales bacterium]